MRLCDALGISGVYIHTANYQLVNGFTEEDVTDHPDYPYDTVLRVHFEDSDLDDLCLGWDEDISPSHTEGYFVIQDVDKRYIQLQLGTFEPLTVEKLQEVTNA